MAISPSNWRLPVAISPKVFASLGLLLASATAVSAYSIEVRDECRADYFEYCSDFEVGSPQLRHCMEAEHNRLSRGCIVALEQDGDVPGRFLHLHKKR